MAESTLALRKIDLESKLGTFAGWGRGEQFGDVPWQDYQKAIIEDSVNSGCRRFYWPDPLDGQTTSHSWSFFKPVTQIPLPSSAEFIILPDDYGNFEGNLTIKTAQNGVTAQPWKIQWLNEARIREMYTVTASVIGPPMYACPVPVKSQLGNGAAGQRFHLLVFPKADQDYIIEATYNITPDALTDAFPFALGGAQHSETVLESCLAVMEERIDDTKGVHALAYAKRLTASIDIDRRNRPQRIGYNDDRSDNQEWQRPNLHWYAPAATYNGMPLG